MRMATMNELQIQVKGTDTRKLHDLAKMAAQSQMDVRIVKNGFDADAKSILSVLALEIRDGEILTIRTEDHDVLNNIREIYK